MVQESCFHCLSSVLTKMNLKSKVSNCLTRIRPPYIGDLESHTVTDRKDKEGLDGISGSFELGNMKNVSANHSSTIPCIYHIFFSISASLVFIITQRIKVNLLLTMQPRAESPGAGEGAKSPTSSPVGHRQWSEWDTEQTLNMSSVDSKDNLHSDKHILTRRSRTTKARHL